VLGEKHISGIKCENPGEEHASFLAPSADAYEYKDKSVSSLVVSLGKVLNGIASTFEWLDW